MAYVVMADLSVLTRTSMHTSTSTTIDVSSHTYIHMPIRIPVIMSCTHVYVHGRTHVCTHGRTHCYAPSVYEHAHAHAYKGARAHVSLHVRVPVHISTRLEFGTPPHVYTQWPYACRRAVPWDAVCPLQCVFGCRVLCNKKRAKKRLPLDLVQVQVLGDLCAHVDMYACRRGLFFATFRGMPMANAEG